MSEPSDPPRIIDPASGASPRLKELVERSRTDVGSETEVRALESKLSPMLWPGGAAPGPGTAAGGVGAKAGAVLAIKVGAALLVAGGGGIWLSARHSPEPQPMMPATPTAAARPTAVAAPAEPALPTEPVLPVEPTVDVPPRAQATPFTTSHERSLPAESVSESDLLGQAQASLASDPLKALSLTARHRGLFPHGVLAQEREVIAIEALTELGRTAEAKARAERFLRAFPGSAHQNKVRSLVGLP